MGTGVCSRRQKSLLHTGFCLLALLGLGSGVYLYNYMLNKARISDAQSLKYKQQQETLSAQLQVVYEHRSRLERSLQKEKGEHKKTKEDYLVYKLEAQEALNKEKQDSMNRYGALSSQHKILKNQHEEIKKQLSDLQVEHSNLKLEHRKAVEVHSQRLSQLQREKDNEILNLQDTVSKLREESKLLRKAHQDVHTQLLNAQAQVEEFRQLKDALKKMPSFKDRDADTLNPPSNKKVPQISLGNERAVEYGPRGASHGLPQPAAPDDTRLHNPSLNAATIRQGAQNDSHIARFTRTVNSLQSHKEDENQVILPHAGQPSQQRAVVNDISLGQPSLVDKKTPTVKVLVAKEQVPIHSWQDIVNKVNARMTEEVSVNDPLLKSGARQVSVPAGNWENRVSQLSYPKAEAADELEMDAGMIDREENLQSPKRQVGPETLALEDAMDPAKDPNNQGEDEFEEAEIGRPEFDEKPGEKDPLLHSAEKKGKLLQTPDTGLKSREEPDDRYQDDQEQDLEEQEVDANNTDDLELAPEEGADNEDPKNRRAGYY